MNQDSPERREEEYLTWFESSVKAAGATIDRREIHPNELMGGVSYVYKLTKGERHCLYPLHSFYMLAENRPLASMLAAHAFDRLTTPSTPAEEARG